MIPARSVPEAMLWAELAPCECGSLETDWDVTRLEPPFETPGRAAVELSGACDTCGRVRSVEFEVPWPADVPPYAFATADAEPSALLDPAVWRAVSEQYREAVDRRLAGADSAVGRDRDRWQEVVELLRRSLAGLDETLRFLPADASDVPADAFRLPHTRSLRRDKPELFSRETLETERAARVRALEEFLAAHPPPAAEQLTDEDQLVEDDERVDGSDDDGEILVAGVRLDRLRAARTVAEAELYMSLHPCACGSAEIPPRLSSTVRDGVRVLRYTGRCPACGVRREFAFRAPSPGPIPADGSWAPGPEPSELLDPGEWLHVTDLLLDAYSGPPDELEPEERETLRHDLASSAAAVDEALKFLPTGATRVPESAFRSEIGRTMWRTEPGRFSRIRLEAIRDAYRRGAADLGR